MYSPYIFYEPTTRDWHSHFLQTVEHLTWVQVTTLTVTSTREATAFSDLGQPLLITLMMEKVTARLLDIKPNPYPNLHNREKGSVIGKNILHLMRC